MQCFHDYRRFCPKVSEEWAIDLNLSAPPPQRKFGSAAYVLYLQHEYGYHSRVASVQAFPEITEQTGSLSHKLYALISSKW